VIPIVMALLAVALAGQSTRPIRHEQLTAKRDGPVPGVDLSTYTLITSNLNAERQEAESILDVKVAWPRAMSTKNEALFNRILSHDFTLRAHGQLYERDAYIRDRMLRPERVESARYDNVVVQIFGSMAVLTYNVVLVTKAEGVREMWHGSWADVFVRERGRWKIGASHLISERVEKEPPSK
jgi:hypothetical protein